MSDVLDGNYGDYKIEAPVWECPVHGEIDVAIVITEAGSAGESFCALCWRDWMRDQGWGVNLK